jgi:hypothetical protein
MPRCEMISRRASRTLERTMGKVLKEQNPAGNPALWIHISQAGKWLLSPREARKRAVIRLLDSLKTGLPARKKPLL